MSSRREGYLSGVAHAARMAADGSSAEDLIATVEHMTTEVLDLDDTRYVPPNEHRPDPDRPVLDRDATPRWRGHTVDVGREGLPTMDTIELEAGRGGGDGRFLLTAASGVCSAPLDRRPARLACCG